MARMRYLAPRTSSFPHIVAIALLAAIACSSELLQAQTAANSGQIVGLLLDASGASVAGAHVSVRNKDTNYTRDLATDSGGRFSAPQIPLGSYEIGVTASGFEPQIQQVIVGLGSSVSVNFHLSVGSKNETIQVIGEELALEPTQAQAK